MAETSEMARVLEEEAANFDEMAESSRKIAFVRLCLSDETGAAYWRGRARGLELAAANLRDALPSPPDPR